MTATSFESGLFCPRTVSSRKSLAAFLSSLGVVTSPAAASSPEQSEGTSRLVKGPQFPTRFFADPETGEAIEIKPEWAGQGSTAPGAYTVLSYRQWDDTWRLRPQVDPSKIQTPMAEAGPRVTEAMTHNGRKAIDESARYLASIGKGYRTMLTLTADNAARQRIAVQLIEGDYSDLKSRETVEVTGRYCPLAWHQNEILPNMPEAEGLHSLKPVTTLQKEASRFFDAAQKIYGRGMDYTEGRDYKLEDGTAWTINSVGTDGKPLKCRLEGHPTGAVAMCEVHVFENDKGKKVFERKGNASIPRPVRDAAVPGAPFTLIKLKLEAMRYCWAAENPKNDKGQDNPHIHVNIDWEVPLGAFRDWAARLEGVWGQGFANLQRLRDPAAAGAYLLKAAGYLAKGTDGNQGWIVGNRYFVSSTARAPKFQGVAVLPYGQLPLLMEHAAEHQREALAPLRRAREAAQVAIREATKQGNKKGKGILAGRIKHFTKQIEGRRVIAGKWQMLLKGVKGLWDFLAWAGEAGDSQAQGFELPSKPAGFSWHHNMDDGNTAWHTTPTADIVDRRTFTVTKEQGKQAKRESKSWARALLKMPITTFDYSDSLRDWAEQWEPVECFA